MTFDCTEEAIKIKRANPGAHVVLRIEVEKTDALAPISKFGAPASLHSDILDNCKKLGLKFRGVSFHVGTGGCSFGVYE